MAELVAPRVCVRAVDAAVEVHVIYWQETLEAKPNGESPKILIEALGANKGYAICAAPQVVQVVELRDEKVVPANHAANRAVAVFGESDA